MVEIVKLPLTVDDLQFSDRNDMGFVNKDFPEYVFKQAKPRFENGQRASVLYRNRDVLSGPLIYEIWASDKDEPEYPFTKDEANAELLRIQGIPPLQLEYRPDE